MDEIDAKDAGRDLTPWGELLDYREVGRKIAEARDDRGMTQADLAVALSNGRSTVAQWETGQRRVSLNDLMRIGQVVGKPLQYFVGIDFEGADEVHTVGLLREAKRRLDELAASTAQVELPGLLAELVEVARQLREEAQRDLLKYARLLLTAQESY